jgi:hypothetical protein
LAKGLKAVTEFRVIKQHISNASKIDKLDLLSKRFKEFVEDPGLRVDHLEIQGAGVAAQVKKMTKDVAEHSVRRPAWPEISSWLAARIVFVVWSSSRSGAV